MHASLPRRLWLLLILAATGGVSCKNISGGKADEGAVGAACEPKGEVEADCAEVDEPICLKMPGGYCSAECSGGGVFDCDLQSICEQLGDRAFFCLDGCLVENGNNDCREEYRCSLRPDVSNLDGRPVGVCMAKCESNADCETGRRCDLNSGDCVPRGERATGESCGNHGVCNGGLCVKSDEFRGGYCSATCGNQFQTCEPGSTCIEQSGNAICLTSCDDASDCREDEGYTCRKIGEKKDASGDAQSIRVCVPRCQSDDECTDGFHCDVGSGDCVEGIGDPNPLGAFCEDDAQCADGTCVRGSGWTNGYCTRSCGDGCGEGVCDDTIAGEICLEACESDLDCRVSYVCVEGGCRPPCTGDEECAGDSTCNESTGRCEPPSTSGAEVSSVEIASGVSVRGELSRELTLEVPAGVQSFAILASGSGPDLMLIGEMTDPTGRKIYDFQDPFGSRVRFFPSDDFITQYVPTSPRSAPVPGTYAFKLIKDGSPSSIDVRALIKTSDGALESGRLDLNFFLANLSDLDANSTQTDSEFQSAVQQLEQIYAARGIEVGNVNYCDITGADADRFAVVDDIEGPTAELGRMFALSGEAGRFGCQDTGPTLNFFLVQEIVGGRAGYIILGIAGGIPGPPPGVNGTTHSGVAITMTGFRRSPQQLAQTMAHEGGHYLGLFHTTEAEGNAFDPLPDTPECSSRDRDRNGDGLVGYDECLRGSGAENLMFWAAGDAAEDVSNDQSFVVVRNPGLE